MSNIYEIEKFEFIKNFKDKKNKKIVLYGIGRLTATLVNSIKEFQIVGVMDKNPDNIGKEIFGLPILSLKKAEQLADIIIINTTEAYWNIIYNRIKDSKIPVYFKNGELAKDESLKIEFNSYWDSSMKELISKIESADIVSFDFFDTLFSRYICDPKDIFWFIEMEIKEKLFLNIPFFEIRMKAIKNLHENYNLDELYEKMAEIENNISKESWNLIKKIELLIEEEMIIPEKTILKLIKYAQHIGKVVYIVSDMYLSKEFYKKIMEKNKINISYDYILISNEMKYSKQKGDFWDYYKKKIICDKKALHIGDSLIADIKNAKERGFDVYYIANKMDLLGFSTLKSIKSQICTIYDSVIMGIILNKMYTSPFCLNNTKGKYRISNNFDMGYIVFGPVILTFLIWLLQKVKSDKIEKLIFMSRDGFFLKEDFDFFCCEISKTMKTSYLGVSRQLLMIATIKTRKELIEYINMPYSGSFAELLEDRFEIQVSSEDKFMTIDNFEKYEEQAWKYVVGVRNDYLNYLKKFKIDEGCALVDLSYHGSNQKYLNAVSEVRLSGYYLYADTSSSNINASIQTMKSCYQGVGSNMLKNGIYLESFLTAPYGMLKRVDKDGKFLCKEKKNNQLWFESKKEINNGVKAFIHSYCEKFGRFNISTNSVFIDFLYGKFFKESIIEIEKNVKESFFYDNAMMNRFDTALFD